MKNSNLLNRLLSYSHEKQSPQRFFCYAAMLILLLTLGVGQVLAKNIYAVRYSLPGDGVNTKCHNWGGTEGTSTVWPGTLMTRWTTMNAGSNEIYTCELADPRNDYAEFVNQNNTSDRSGNKYFPNTYPQPTYANGSWWYSPRLTSALWGSAQHVYGGRVYFDNSDAKWNDSYMYLVIGHDTYLAYYQLTKLGGTKICYVDLGGQSWKDAKYIALAGHTGPKSTDDTPNDLVDLTHFSDANSYSMDYQSTYMITMSSGENCTPINIAYESGGYSAFNYSQTFYRVFNGSATTTNVGSVSISTTKLSDHCAGSEGNSTASIASGNSYNSADAVKTATVTLTASPADGYYFVGWYTAATGGDLVNTNTTMSYTCTGTRTLYARFETRHTITVNAGSNGTTTPSSGGTVTAGYYTSAAINASANPGYYFTNWTKNNNNVSFGSSTSTASNSVTATGTATVTANFAPIWAILGSQASNTSTGTDGFGGWSTGNNNNLITGYTTVSGDLVGSVNVTLEANKDYQFKMYARANGGGGTFYGNNTSTQYMKYTPSEKNTDWLFETGKENCGITTAGAGTYQFKWNMTDKTLTVVYPTSYTVTFGHGTGGSTVTASGSISGTITTGQYVAEGEDVTFTQTAASGYTFKEWNTQADGNGDQLGTGASLTLSSIGENKNVYAIYTPNVYRVRFDLNGGDSFSANGSSSEDGTGKYIDVTYDASLAGLTPPRPVKNGYVFKCWSTDPVLWQGKYLWTEVPLNSGTFAWSNAAINSDYISSTTTWKKADNIILYAHYYTPSVLSIGFSPEHAMPEADITATVSFNPSVYRGPEGDYTLCYTLTTTEGTPLRAQPEWKNQDDATYQVTFKAPSSPGDYSLLVKLFAGTGDVCGGNSPVTTFQGGSGGAGGGNPYDFDVEEMNPITITYECGGVELRESTTIYATWNNRATITAPSIPGLKFDHWEYTNCTIDGGEAGIYNRAEATFYAFTTGSAKAVYTQGSLFFKNTLNWDHVYVYFYDTDGYFYQNNKTSEGTGSSSSWEDKNDGNHKPFISGPIEMSLLEGTDDVYYFDEEINGTMPTFEAVAFTKERLVNQSYFAGKTATTDPCHVVYVNAFDDDKPMIVPVGNGALWNLNYAKYYSHDLAPLLQDWGALIKSNVDSYATTHHLKSAKMGDLTFSTKIYLPRYSYNYQWILTQGATSYGRDSYPTLDYDSPTSDQLISGKGNLLAKTNIPGEYTFTVTYGTETSSEVYTGAATSDGLVKHATVTLSYPLNEDDYRLVYDDSNLNPHPSDIIRKEDNGEAIVNMFYNPNASPVLKVQSCTDVSTSGSDDTDPITWSTPTTLSLSDFSSVLTDTCVYNFTITLDENGENPAVSKVEKYNGRFYVRTDCRCSYNQNYKDVKDSCTMTYSDYSTTLTKKPYSHYYVKDIHGESSSVNIRFTVATDYSEAVTDTVFAGDVSGDYQDYFGSETLHLTQNVRFTYDQKTNKIWRAYTEGPTNNNYMVLRSGSKLYANKDDVSPTATFKFADMGNWVYQVDVYSQVNSMVKLTADIHNKDASNNSDVTAEHNTRQYLKGIDGVGDDKTEWTSDDAIMLLGGSGDSKEHMRINYDFKTDRMTTAWIPADTVKTDLAIHADVMLIRREQEGATSIIIGKKDATHYAELTDVGKAYGVMEFRKSYINEPSLSRFERNLYWISFPFDVKLSDVFGFGKYGQHWIIEYYDGKGRAQKGYWADSEPNWKYVTEEVKDEFELKANEGYILALALSNMGPTSEIWESGRISSVYLYFPSKNNIGNITNITSYEMPLDSAGYKCNITRDHRDVKDSYWHCIGVPSYGLNRLTDVATSVPGNEENWSTPLPYVYKWDSIYNKLEIASSSTFTFQAMKSYLIQYANNKIVWANVTNKPKSVVSRERIEGENADFYEWRLNLMRDNKRLDHTYIRLSEDENATEGYDFGNDLSKEFNSGANIFTYVDGIEVAGNVMPVVYGQTRTVPVGVKITEAGDYTFSMPEGINGTGVVLIDNIAGTRTNLALEDYTVNLTQGNIDNRFMLEISPIVQSPTDIEQTSSDSKDGVRKVMVDGILYIVKDGKVFDAQGNRIK